MKTTLAGVALAASLMCCVSSDAAIVFDNGGPLADSNHCISGPNACGSSGNWTDYGHFSLTEAVTLTGFSNWITSGTVTDYNSTNWSIWNVTPSLSGTPGFSGNSVGSIFQNQGFDEVDVSGLSITLLPGSYWLGINEQAANGSLFTYVNSSLAAPATTIELDGQSVMFTGLAPMAFTISGTTIEMPEPTSVALFCLGLLAFGALRCQRTAKAGGRESQVAGLDRCRQVLLFGAGRQIVVAHHGAQQSGTPRRDDRRVQVADRLATAGDRQRAADAGEHAGRDAGLGRLAVVQCSQPTARTG